MNSDVAKLLTGSTCKLDNESDLKSKKPKTFTATISGVSKVYNLFPGTVLFLGYYQNMGTVTIAVSNHEIVRYLNLKDIQIWNSSKISAGQYLGETHKNKPLQFEYCTQWKGDSLYPVRVKNSLYFKQNPIDILEGLYVPENELNVKYGAVTTSTKIKFRPEQLSEWGPTNIDNSDTYVEGAQIVKD